MADGQCPEQPPADPAIGGMGIRPQDGSECELRAFVAGMLAEKLFGQLAFGCEVPALVEQAETRLADL